MNSYTMIIKCFIVYYLYFSLPACDSNFPHVPICLTHTVQSNGQTAVQASTAVPAQDGMYSSILNISQLYSSKSMLWIYSQHPKEHANKFLALCKLYFTRILAKKLSKMVIIENLVPWHCHVSCLYLV
jgi:hypothetical protein